MTAAARGGRHRILWGAIAMARPSTLRRRIDRVLDESRRIHGGLSRGRWIALLLVSAVMLCGAAALQLQTAPPPPPTAAERDARLRAELEEPYQKWLTEDVASSVSFQEPAAKALSEEEKRSRDERLRKELESPYRKWLTEDVGYIITAEESQSFKRLSTDDERENFIEQFWLKRDPTPDTMENEYKEEHYRRIAYANNRFASGIPGWKTDRGRIYITFGPPDELESHPSGGQVSYPYEIWRYRWIERIGKDVVIEFVDPSANGEYRMTVDPSEKDALRTVPKTGPALMDAWSLFPQPSPQSPPAATDSGITVDAFPMQVQVNYAIMNGSTVTQLAVTFFSKDFPSPGAKDAQALRVNIYGRITTLSNRRVMAFDDTVPLLAQPSGSQEAGNFTYHKSIALSPGNYRLTIVAKDLATGRTASRELTITVPGRE
jgi:GWxTD domain-containing protein